ncbi:MAG TPA: FecR family protein [Pyrinomonadaceae bacterium]|nr:FecR family protein [Pyrinomonadaceae bacterium]
MKKRELRYFLSITGLALCLAFGVLAQAQNKEKYIISAKAGGINLVSGNVTVERAGAKSAQALSSNDNLESGDKVITGMGGRVEVLLNPGSYLRMDENSEFEFTDAAMDNLRIKLVRGSIIVEASSAEDVNLAIEVSTQQTDATIIKGGLYRFNILADGTTEIAVRKGRLFYGHGTQAEIKGGQKVLIGHGRIEVAKLNKKEMDALDLWSKDRAEYLAKANRQLQPRTLMASFNSYYWDNWANLAWSNPTVHSRGYWVYDPNQGRHCFLPGDGRHWSSPYGHHYSNGVVSNGNGQVWTRGGGGGGGSQSGGNGGNWSGRGGGGDSSSGRGNSSSGGSSNGWSGGNSMPVSAPASQPAMSEPSIPRAAESHIERAQGEGRSPNN